VSAILINGQFLSANDAQVSAFDAGFQHGVGLFETLLGGCSENGPWALHLEDHLLRLATSASQLGLSDDLRTAGLSDAVKSALERAELPRARVRLTVTGGDLNMLSRARQGGSSAAALPTVMVHVQPATAYPDELFDAGVSVVLASLRVNPLDPTAGHKTLNYWARLRELQQAAVARAGEALVFQVTNHLSGGCVSNAFLVGEERGRPVLFTPIARGEETDVADVSRAPELQGAGEKGVAMPSPVLPGVVREWVMDRATSMGLIVQRKMLTIDDVLAAREVFLTNSSWGVMPVVKVESHAVGDGRVGPLTREMVAAWREDVEVAARAE
jgi:branched-chain amino acid aminotransferase